MEQTWASYINSLNQNSLPRRVEVTDGNYFSGSLAHLSFSKGDIITVTDLQPIHVRAEVKDGEQVLGVVNIPLEYKEGPLMTSNYATAVFSPRALGMSSHPADLSAGTQRAGNTEESKKDFIKSPRRSGQRSLALL